MAAGLKSQDNLYICPGENRPISRSVHLARLAAFFPACRECPFRTDTGQLSKSTVERLQLTEHRVERASLFTTEGVRGVYINELTRVEAARMAAALAKLLWQDSPLIGHSKPRVVRGSPDRAVTSPRRPSIVVGHDERPSSPDIVTGVVASLRQMGCQIIDVSVTTRPCFWFAVDHLNADAGIFVTGAGCPPAWTGLDFAGPHGVPLSQHQADPCGAMPPGLNLHRIEHQLRQPFGRATRQAGSFRSFQAAVPYEAGLWKHFHELQPLNVACACPNRLTRQTLKRLFDKLPCRLELLDVPHRVRNLNDPDDADVQRMSDAVVHRRADLGVLIDDDGQRCGFIDERGELVSAGRIARLLCGWLLPKYLGGTAAIEDSSLASLRPVVEELEGTAVSAGRTLAETAAAMREHTAIIGGGDSGRIWFRESTPTSDAILTVAHVLALLSRSNGTFSEIGRDGGA